MYTESNISHRDCVCGYPCLPMETVNNWMGARLLAKSSQDAWVQVSVFSLTRMGPWTIYFTSPSLGFLIHKMGIIIIIATDF